jgi:hypothetical protein
VPTLSATAQNALPLYPAFNAIDGDVNTMAISPSQNGNWLSVMVPTGTLIGNVAVYNRIDLTGFWPSQLGTFEIWVGPSPGSQASLCGTASYRALSGYDTEPYIIDCTDLASTGPFVTVRQVGPARYLALAEVEIYQATARAG